MNTSNTKSNKKFYENLLEYEKAGLLKFMPRNIETDFCKVKLGSVVLAVHYNITHFIVEISLKEREHQLFTQSELEGHLQKSASFISKLVRQGEYLRFTRGKGMKFYIKKDWED